MILRSACLDLIGNIAYNQAEEKEEKERNEIEEFEVRFLETMDKLNRQEDLYVHPSNACSRPHDLF